ncbi:hypothetical protein G9A89_010202 [Geosiphon pyriformis]|nr:hypothetical protein G9A89_010202 [Geosiphon pyriformis]
MATQEVLDTFLLGIAALVTVFYQLLFFIIAYFFQFDKFTDFAGGSNFIIIAIISLVLGQEYYTRQVVAATLQIVWGIRLGAFCYYRVYKSGGFDSRFDEMREKFFNFLGFWIFQMVWVWTCSLPVIFVNSPRVGDPERGGRDVDFGTATDIIGLVLFVFGLSIESIADIQKLRFRLSRSSSLEIMEKGVWAWSRHPNYFGEITVIFFELIFIFKWGIFFLCIQPTISGVGTNLPWISILSPLFTTTLLLFVSGIPLAERPTQKKQVEAGNEASYLSYLERTSILIPLPPALYKRFPESIKRTILLDFPFYRYKAPASPKLLSTENTKTSTAENEQDES